MRDPSVIFIYSLSLNEAKVFIYSNSDESLTLGSIYHYVVFLGDHLLQQGIHLAFKDFTQVCPE